MRDEFGRTDQRPLTNLPTLPGVPDWSPDGTQIVFHASRGDGNFDLFAMNVDGSNIRRLTGCGPTCGDSRIQPRWSPDGQRIAFIWYTSTVEGTFWGKAAVMDADVFPSQEVCCLPSGFRLLNSEGYGDGTVSWSPDSRLIAFPILNGMMRNGTMTHRNRIIVKRLDAVSSTGMTMGDALADYGDLAPTWSRSTGRIFFVSNRTGEQWLYSMRMDGSDVRQVAHLNGSILNPHSK